MAHLALLGQSPLGHWKLQDLVYTTSVLEVRIDELGTEHLASISSVAEVLAGAVKDATIEPIRQETLLRFSLVVNCALDVLRSMLTQDGTYPSSAMRSSNNLEHNNVSFQPKYPSKKGVGCCVRAAISPVIMESGDGRSSVGCRLSLSVVKAKRASSSAKSASSSAKRARSSESQHSDAICDTCSRPISRKAKEGHCMGTGRCSSKAADAAAEICVTCSRPISRKAKEGHCMGKGNCSSDAAEICGTCSRPISRKAKKNHCMGKGKCDAAGLSSGAAGLSAEALGNCGTCLRPISKKAKRDHCMGKGKCFKAAPLHFDFEGRSSLPEGLPPMVLFGGPGTGKTYQLKRLHNILQHRLPENACVMVAVFGVVAQRIGGQTLASWAGTGTSEGSLDDWVRAVEQNQSACARWRAVQALLLDDLSPLGAHDFNKFEALARKIRKNTKWFGGIFVALTVDFLQILSLDQPPRWMADAWSSRVIPHGTLVNLTEQHRFDHLEDAALLNRVRTNSLEPSDVARLQGLSENNVAAKDPLHIFPLRQEVVDYHSSMVDHILTSTSDPRRVLRFKSLMMKNGVVGVHTEQTFITGMRIMFTVNNLHGRRGRSFGGFENFEQPIYANGTFGRVVASFDCAFNLEGLLNTWLQRQGTFQLPVVVLEDEPHKTYVLKPILFDALPTGQQMIALPMEQAMAVTIHKTLGMTLPAAVVHLSSLGRFQPDSAFCRHAVYEALSRCGRLDDVCAHGFQASLMYAPQCLNPRPPGYV